MKVSKRCHYALRALVDLGIAQALGRPLVQIGDLAQEENLPVRFLEQIFIQLRHAGVIESKRGTLGGYQLALPASEIHFGEVIRLLDGESLDTACADCGENAACRYPEPSVCGIHALFCQVDRAVSDIVDQTTVGDTVRRTLRKIRRNKIAVPFVKMLMRRTPRKPSAARTVPTKKTAKPVRVKTRRKPIRKRHGL